ncbi:Hypothetical predicted protein [Mytilus galloprovincialis]|uniref:Uncharacterized protein n=1 Tax=Mytilus galloprovincialis TaxID=29158 RepID=A0A8B6FVK7_MYTGA|nr:Hypothetical predicted protein [Mytilus galloprovincialis]
MSSKGFRQLVSSPTTEGGTLIDHVYVKGCLDTQVAIIPTYYSYHEALKIVIPNDEKESLNTQKLILVAAARQQLSLQLFHILKYNHGSAEIPRNLFSMIAVPQNIHHK